MIEITLMNHSHLAEAIEIERECFSDPWGLVTLTSEIENTDRLYIVACDNGKLVGYAGMASVLDEGHIHNVAIAPAYRKMGIARTLVSELLTCAKESSLRSILLEVRASNEAALALYRSFGFEISGLRKRYYQNPVEDALLMTLNL